MSFIEQYGDMVILEYLGRKNQQRQVRVKCQICGKERIVAHSNLLRAGQTHSLQTCKEGYFKAIKGKIYGDYEVIGFSGYKTFVIKCTKCGHIKK